MQCLTNGVTNLSDNEIAEIRVMMTNCLILEQENQLLKTQVINYKKLSELYFKRLENQNTFWGRNQFFIGVGVGIGFTAVIVYLLK